MSLIKIKSGVIVSQQVIITAAVINAANILHLPDMLITSGRDGKHMPGSFHYFDKALDFRTKHLTTAQKHKLLSAVRKRLGEAYQAFLEFEGKANEHMHVELDDFGG